MKEFDLEKAEKILHATPTVKVSPNQSFEQLVNLHNEKTFNAVRLKIRNLFPGFAVTEEGFGKDEIAALLQVGGNCVIRAEPTQDAVKLCLQQATPMIGEANIERAE